MVSATILQDGGSPIGACLRRINDANDEPLVIERLSNGALVTVDESLTRKVIQPYELSQYAIVDYVSEQDVALTLQGR